MFFDVVSPCWFFVYQCQYLDVKQVSGYVLNNFFLEFFFHCWLPFLCSVFDLFGFGLYGLCMFLNSLVYVGWYALLCFVMLLVSMNLYITVYAL